ncbi:hypothetical protein EDC96DRAFT_211014, partial [Choanephora cucurbitarum]
DKLSNNVFSCLVEYYNTVYCSTYVDAQISFANPKSLPVDWHATKFKTIDILGNKYTSTEASRLKNRGSYALAYHQDENGASLRYCQIHSMFRHTVVVEEDDGSRSPQVHTLAYVKWYTKSDMRFHYFNNADFQKYGMELIRPHFEADSSSSIIPVSQLYCQVAIALKHIEDSHVVLPLPRKSFV